MDSTIGIPLHVMDMCTWITVLLTSVGLTCATRCAVFWQEKVEIN